MRWIICQMHQNKSKQKRRLDKMANESRIEIEANREMVIAKSLEMVKNFKDGESMIVIITRDEGESTNVQTTVALHGSSAHGMALALEEVRERVVKSIEEETGLDKSLKLKKLLEKLLSPEFSDFLDDDED